MNEADFRVVEIIGRYPNGASALVIAKAALGDRARRYSKDALIMIGLQVAARMVGENVLVPTRSNMFTIARE